MRTIEKEVTIEVPEKVAETATRSARLTGRDRHEYVLDAIRWDINFVWPTKGQGSD